MAIKLEGRWAGGKALMAWQLVEELIFAAYLNESHSLDTGEDTFFYHIFITYLKIKDKINIMNS